MKLYIPGMYILFEKLNKIYTVKHILLKTFTAQYLSFRSNYSQKYPSMRSFKDYISPISVIQPLTLLNGTLGSPSGVRGRVLGVLYTAFWSVFNRWYLRASIRKSLHRLLVFTSGSSSTFCTRYSWAIRGKRTCSSSWSISCCRLVKSCCTHDNTAS